MNNANDDWSAWLSEQGGALILFARQWVASHADAEDVVQEAFARFWKSRHQVKEPLPYLYSCVRHRAFDWLRTRQRQSRREEAAARPEAERLFASPLEVQERQAVIEAALAGLPENQREVLVLKIWGGLTFPQIAEVVGVSPETASSRYRYALAKLQESLSEESIP